MKIVIVGAGISGLAIAEGLKQKPSVDVRIFEKSKGVGVLIVTGLSKLSNTSRLSWISSKAPVISAALVIVSGVFALLIAHKG